MYGIDSTGLLLEAEGLDLDGDEALDGAGALEKEGESLAGKLANCGDEDEEDEEDLIDDELLEVLVEDDDEDDEDLEGALEEPRLLAEAEGEAEAEAELPPLTL